MYYIFVALQFLDALTTYVGLSSGTADEFNPIAQQFINVAGLLPALIIAKVIGTTIIIALVLVTKCTKLMPWLNLLMAFVVYNNLTVIF